MRKEEERVKRAKERILKKEQWTYVFKRERDGK